MQKQVVFILILCSFSLLAQNSSFLITGKIQTDSLAIKNAHIINTSNKIGTNSNDVGFFEIPVKIGDTLEFSHLKYDFEKIYITKATLDSKFITITGYEKTHALEEFNLNNTSIFYVDKEIMPHNLPIVNAQTLKLPYANSKKVKSNSILNIRSGASINLENLIARINGNYKRTLKAKELYTEDKQLSKIRALFTDDFFITDLNIKKEYINQFLNFCKNKPIISTFKNNDLLELVDILRLESKKFPHQIENEDIFLTQIGN